MTMLVVIEEQKTKEHHEHEVTDALSVQCLCGGSIHPILGAWCILCGAKVVNLQRRFDTPLTA